jgi:hypothetical protein
MKYFRIFVIIAGSIIGIGILLWCGSAIYLRVVYLKIADQVVNHPDRILENRLDQAKLKIYAFYDVYHRIPTSTEELETSEVSAAPDWYQGNFRNFSLKDIMYHPVTKSGFELCAQFYSDTLSLTQPVEYYERVSKDFWNHSAGMYCFSSDVLIENLRPIPDTFERKRGRDPVFLIDPLLQKLIR